MRRCCRVPVALVLAACSPLVLAAGAAPSTSQSAPLAPLLDAATAYVSAYQAALTHVVADELYTQDVVEQFPRDGLRPLTRALRSEIFFMFTAGHDWMAVREVRAVDGRPVEGGPDVRAALRDDAAPSVAGRFKAYNSRFNVGRVARNFNEPTLSLLVLDARHRARFSFERLRTREEGGVRSVTIGFRERRAPTLIHDLDGRPAYASGEIDVEPESGRISRARLSVTMGTVRATLSTRYAMDARLGIMVPTRFGERYVDGAPPGRAARARGRYEDIRCEARYANFRRFEVASRIR